MKKMGVTLKMTRAALSFSEVYLRNLRPMSLAAALFRRRGEPMLLEEGAATGVDETYQLNMYEATD